MKYQIKKQLNKDINAITLGQLHHYASNKNQNYTKEFETITNKYKLDLGSDWNKKINIIIYWQSSKEIS